MAYRQNRTLASGCCAGVIDLFFSEAEEFPVRPGAGGIREDEVAASVMGIKTTWFKVWAFAIGLLSPVWPAA